MCRAGYQNLCPTVQFAGHGTLDGALQEHLLWPDHLLFPLPDELSDDGGALLEPLGVAIHAVRAQPPAAGVRRAGGGRRTHRGARVAGGAPVRSGHGSSSSNPSSTAGRRRCAAVPTAVWAPEHAADAVLEATAGRGVDVVIEMAGTDAAIEIAVAAIRPGGRIVLGGIPSEDRSSFPAAAARRKGLTFTMVRRMNATYPRAIELASSAIDLDLLVTDRYPLTRGRRRPSPRPPSGTATRWSSASRRRDRLLQPHHSRRRTLVQLDGVRPGPQEVAERPEAERLFAERRVHPLHLSLDRRVVQPVGVVLLQTDLQGALEQPGGRGLRVGFLRLLVVGGPRRPPALLRWGSGFGPGSARTRPRRVRDSARTPAPLAARRR